MDVLQIIPSKIKEPMQHRNALAKFVIRVAVVSFKIVIILALPRESNIGFPENSVIQECRLQFGSTVCQESPSKEFLKTCRWPKVSYERCLESCFDHDPQTKNTKIVIHYDRLHHVLNPFEHVFLSKEWDLALSLYAAGKADPFAWLGIWSPVLGFVEGQRLSPLGLLQQIISPDFTVPFVFYSVEYLLFGFAAWFRKLCSCPKKGGCFCWTT